jgi:hypothetical protein
VLAIQLGQLDLGILQLRGGLGQIDAPFGEIQIMRTIVLARLRQPIDGIARARLLGLGIAAQSRVVGELVEAAGQPIDVDIVLLACKRPERPSASAMRRK